MSIQVIFYPFLGIPQGFPNSLTDETETADLLLLIVRSCLQEKNNNRSHSEFSNSITDAKEKGDQRAWTPTLPLSVQPKRHREAGAPYGVGFGRLAWGWDCAIMGSSLSKAMQSPLQLHGSSKR